MQTVIEPGSKYMRASNSNRYLPNNRVQQQAKQPEEKPFFKARDTGASKYK